MLCDRLVARGLPGGGAAASSRCEARRPARARHPGAHAVRRRRRREARRRRRGRARGGASRRSARPPARGRRRRVVPATGGRRRCIAGAAGEPAPRRPRPPSGEDTASRGLTARSRVSRLGAGAASRPSIQARRAPPLGAVPILGCSRWTAADSDAGSRAKAVLRRCSWADMVSRSIAASYSPVLRCRGLTGPMSAARGRA